MLILSNEDIEKILPVGACQTVSQVWVGGRIELHSHRAAGYQGRLTGDSQIAFSGGTPVVNAVLSVADLVFIGVVRPPYPNREGIVETLKLSQNPEAKKATRIISSISSICEDTRRSRIPAADRYAEVSDRESRLALTEPI